MSPSQVESARQACERILRAEQAYNIEHSILPGENAIAERLLCRGLELADAYEELQDELHRHPNTSGFCSSTHYHVVEVIEAAARSRNPRFTVHVKDRLDDLRAQFDLKYWPTLSDFVSELATDAEASDPQASDPLTAAATASTRPSLADFFRALFTAIEENSAHLHGQLPAQFKVSDGTCAALAN